MKKIFLTLFSLVLIFGSLTIISYASEKGVYSITILEDDWSAGVVTAETLWQARKKCPDLQFVRPHHEKYKKYSRMINEIYYRYTDMVEPFSIDESWLDVTASRTLYGTGKEIAVYL